MMEDLSKILNKKLVDITVEEFRCVLRDVLGNYPLQYFYTDASPRQQYTFIGKNVTNPLEPKC